MKCQKCGSLHIRCQQIKMDSDGDPKPGWYAYRCGKCFEEFNYPPLPWYKLITDKEFRYHKVA